jgi:hypothetical protein
MNSVWVKLLWKEWREHRWKLAALCAVNIAVPALCSIREPETFLGAATATLMFSVPLGAMFIGMGTAAVEQSRGTVRFLQALPTPMVRPAAAKLLLAAITVIAPTIVVIGVGFLWKLLFLSDGSRFSPVISDELTGWIWGIQSVPTAVIVAGAIGGLSFLIWMSAVGVNLSDEVRAGAVGMLAIAAVWAIVGYAHLKVTEATTFVGDQRYPPYWFRVASAAAPGGAAVVHENYADSPEDWWAKHTPYMLAGVLSNGALAAWYVFRFGRVATGKRQIGPIVRRPVAAAWLGPPRRGPIRAILWKQFRETLPLALLGAAIILCLTLMVFQLTIRSYGREGSTIVVRETIQMSLAMWMAIGTFVSVVAGLGVLMDDLRPGLHAFWRSRPINVDGWFATKFVASLLSTIIVLALPPLCVTAYMALAHGEEADVASQIDQFVGCLLIQIAAFCAAVAAMALVRQPVYAAILAFGALAGIIVVSQWLRLTSYRSEEWLIVAGSCLLAPVAAVAAWLAVRHDWGWRG